VESISTARQSPQELRGLSSASGDQRIPSTRKKKEPVRQESHCSTEAQEMHRSILVRPHDGKRVSPPRPPCQTIAVTENLSITDQQNRQHDPSVAGHRSIHPGLRPGAIGH
jgi:hypothetical protein